MGCFGFLKVILIIFSVCYILVGLGLLAVSLWIRFGYLQGAECALNQGNDYFNIALYIAMGIGGFLVLLGIMGCAGTLRISLCLLANFAVLVVAAIGGLIAVCVLAYIYQDRILQSVQVMMNQWVQNGYGSTATSSGNPRCASGHAFDALQRTFQCCGVNGPLDFANIGMRPSCCRNPNACPYTASNFVNQVSNVFNGNSPVINNNTPITSSMSIPDAIASGQIFAQGCGQKLRDHYAKAMQGIVGLSGGIAGFMLLGFVFAIAFCCVM